MRLSLSCSLHSFPSRLMCLLNLSALSLLGHEAAIILIGGRKRVAFSGAWRAGASTNSVPGCADDCNFCVAASTTPAVLKIWRAGLFQRKFPKERWPVLTPTRWVGNCPQFIIPYIENQSSIICYTTNNCKILSSNVHDIRLRAA